MTQLKYHRRGGIELAEFIFDIGVTKSETVALQVGEKEKVYVKYNMDIETYSF